MAPKRDRYRLLDMGIVVDDGDLSRAEVDALSEIIKAFPDVRLDVDGELSRRASIRSLPRRDGQRRSSSRLPVAVHSGG